MLARCLYILVMFRCLLGPIEPARQALHSSLQLSCNFLFLFVMLLRPLEGLDLQGVSVID